MFEKRKVVAVVLLLAFSVGLNAGLNGLDRWMCDPWEPPLSLPYLPGLASAGVGLLIHLYLIRRILPIQHPLAQVCGILISGFLAAVVYSCLMQATNGPGKIIFEISDSFVGPFLIGWFWGPLLTLLERWAYRVDSREQASGSLTKTAEELP